MQIQNTNLPIAEIIPQVISELCINNTLVLSAPPGAGKSTLLPLYLLQTLPVNQKIIILEPRRLAAKSIANRMAELINETVGETIGYKIRFENCTSKKTRIEVVTEGILTRQLQKDNTLNNVGIIIFDEFHERNLNSDLALALCKQVQDILRPDLKLLIMSATIDSLLIANKINSKIIESKGRQYPVNVIYSKNTTIETLNEQIVYEIKNTLKQFNGDVLVFLPGEHEIKKCEDALNSLDLSIIVYPLYGALPYHLQKQAILPNKNGKRKVVLATSIAETSLTIEGIKIVIDSGYVRKSVFDPNSGLSKLITTNVTNDVADQRAGRAGRLSEGTCVRLWTLASQHQLIKHKKPEIEEADLTSLTLNIINWGCKNYQDLFWISEPSNVSYNQAVNLLENLEAVSHNKITNHGKAILNLPCHPRIAHMLLKAENLEQKQLGCDIAALLEERDPLGKDYGIDINLRIERLRSQRSSLKLTKQFQKIEKISSSYRKLLNIEESNSTFDYYLTGYLIAQAFPERIACAKPGNNNLFQISNGKIASAGITDDIANEPWLAIANVDMRDGIGKIHSASPLNPKDLINQVKEVENVKWDKKNGIIIAEQELRIGNIILKSKTINPSNEKCIELICNELKNEFESLLNITDEFKNLQNRILSLKKWEPELNLPNVKTDYLKLNCLEWLAPYLINVRKADELKKIKIDDALYSFLNWELQNALDLLAPEKIVVPSGTKIKINYFENGETPSIYVRLQEVFGLENTPLINNGKVKTVIHLLSPGYKPVQVTSDLKSFWSNLYFEVKKELQRKYPKHSWPNDPINAEAIAKGKSTRK
ncbi:MAG: ATP-dependent helicase HrpB [Bacteroidia bacterium]